MDDKSIFGGVGGIILIILAVSFISGGQNRETISVYSDVCIQPLVNGKCEQPRGPGSKEKFTVHKDRQQVVSNFGSYGSVPQLYTDCAVQNKKNWTCTYPDGSGTIGFSKGVFFKDQQAVINDQRIGIYRISKWHYWLMQLGIVGIKSVSQSAPVNNDPFPFHDNKCDASGCPQYAWYDRHNVSMSNRCYPSMTTPCSELEWEQALGTSLTAQEKDFLRIR